MSEILLGSFIEEGETIIIVDTREKNPIIFDDMKCIRACLNVGDYTSVGLLGVHHVERKSPLDLYSSVIHCHDRFRAEFLRAKDKGVKMSLVVECSRERFEKGGWIGARLLKIKDLRIVTKALDTMSKKYDFSIHWCNNRKEMKKLIKKLLSEEQKL